MKRLGAIFLSVLFLFNCLGVTASTHSCKGELKLISFDIGQNSLECDTGEGQSSMCLSNNCLNSFLSQSCCDNHFYQFNIDDDFERTFQNNLQLKVYSDTIEYDYIVSHPSFDLVDYDYQFYYPPTLTTDIYVILEVFLI